MRIIDNHQYLFVTRVHDLSVKNRDRKLRFWLSVEVFQKYMIVYTFQQKIKQDAH